ncbi:MAG: hybrid sensor histidine kinase/response regulator [Candidatus Eisenbacteria bacterium]
MSGLKKVLAADADISSLLLIDEILGDEHEVIPAGSGGDALAFAVRLTPDLVILDAELPGVSGHDVCRQIRSNRALMATKVVVISSRTGAQERLKAYSAGADDFLSKPLEPTELTAKVQTYLRLRRVDEIEILKGDLLTLIGHETRTPLTAISGTLELLADRLPPDDSDALELHTIASINTIRLKGLIEKAVLFSSIRGGMIDWRRDPIAISSLIADASAAACDRFTNAGVALKVHVPAGLAVVGDPTHLPFVMMTLIENALEHSPSGGTVTITARSADPQVVVEVEDEGPGIAPDQLPTLFNPFSAQDVRHHGSGRGTGLSRALCSEIVTRHGGWIEPVANRVGGACFRILLPRADDLGAVQPSPECTDAGAPR